MDDFTSVSPRTNQDQSDPDEHHHNSEITSKHLPADDSEQLQTSILSPLLLNIEESDTSRTEFLTPDESWNAHQDQDHSQIVDYSNHSTGNSHNGNLVLSQDSAWNPWQIYQPALQICQVSGQPIRPEPCKQHYRTSTPSKLPDFNWFKDSREETPPTYDSGQYNSSNNNGSHQPSAPAFNHQNNSGHSGHYFGTDHSSIGGFDPNFTPNPSFFTPTSPPTYYSFPKSSNDTGISDESTESSPSPTHHHDFEPNLGLANPSSSLKTDISFGNENYSMGDRSQANYHHPSPNLQFEFNWPNATHYRAKICTRNFPHTFPHTRANYHPFANNLPSYYAYNSVPSLAPPIFPNHALDWLSPHNAQQQHQQQSQQQTNTFLVNGNEPNSSNMTYNMPGNFNNACAMEQAKETGFRCGICSRICSSLGGLKKHMQCCAASVRVRQSMVTNQRPACQTVTSAEFYYDVGQGPEPSQSPSHSSPFNNGLLPSMNFTPLESLSGPAVPMPPILKDPVHEPEDQTSRLTCSVCDHVCFSAQSLLQHLSLHGGEDASKLRFHQCPTCGGQFQRLAQYQKHLRMSASCGAMPKDCFECHVCKAPFTRRDSLRDHMRTHVTAIRKLPSSVCPVCNKEVATSRLAAHMLSHTNDKAFVCDICSKSFGSSGSLKKHARVHGTDKPFPCAVCGKGYASRDSLKGHKCIETCGLCSTKIPSLAELQEHIASLHPGSLTFTCPTCRKIFFEENLLNQHINSAHKKPQKRFACSICARTFASKGYLIKHEAGHRAEQVLACSKCKLTFLTRSSLLAHSVLHDKASYMKCPDCSRSYLRKDGLERHLISFHGYTRLLAKQKVEEVAMKEPDFAPSVPDPTVPLIKEESYELLVREEEIIGPSSCKSAVVDEDLLHGIESEEAKTSQVGESVEEEQNREALYDNVLQLLSLTVGMPGLESLGWPQQPVYAILGSILERFGVTRDPDAGNNLEAFRRDVRTLIEQIVKDKDGLKEVLRNRPLDLYVEGVVREMHSQKLRLQEHLAAAKLAEDEEEEEEAEKFSHVQVESQEENSIP